MADTEELNLIKRLAGGRNKFLTLEAIRRAKRLGHNSIREVSDVTDLSEQYVSQVARTAGIGLVTREQEKMYERARLVKQAIKEGATDIKDIQDKTGLTPAQLKIVERRTGTRLPPKSNDNHTLDGLLRQGTSIAQIQRETGKSKTTIISYRRKNGLEEVWKEAKEKLKLDNTNRRHSFENLAQIVANHMLCRAQQQSVGMYLALRYSLKKRQSPEKITLLARLADYVLSNEKTINLTQISIELPENNSPALVAKRLEFLGLYKQRSQKPRLPKNMRDKIRRAFSEASQYASAKDISYFARVPFAAVQYQWKQCGQRGRPPSLGVPLRIASEFYEALDLTNLTAQEAASVLNLNQTQLKSLRENQQKYETAIKQTLKVLATETVTKPYFTK